MNMYGVIIFLIYCGTVFCAGIDDQKDRGYDSIRNDDVFEQGWIGNKNGIQNDRGQRYPGIWYGSERNGPEYEDDRYNYDRQNGRNYDNYDQNGQYNNRYGQGIRIGVNGIIGNNRYDEYDRSGLRGQGDLRTQLLLNAGLRGNLELNSAFRAGLGLNADLRARLGLNAGLGLGGAGGLSLGSGLRVGLDLSLGGDQDKQEDLVRPCQMEDYQCIRKFFAENSQCSPSYGPAPDPLYLDQNTMFMPSANLSYTLTNVKITGMANAKISDLYINRVTGNVVLSIQINNLNETSPKAYLSYKRAGKEPVILSDTSTILFAKLTLTAVLPRIPNLRLDLADIHAYVDSGIPEYQLGPGAYTSKDPDVTSAFLQLSTNLGLTIREGFLLQAQLLAALFIQLNICDFGVNLISY